MPFVERDSARLFYDAVGEGSAILFCHGAGGSGLSWLHQIPAFSNHHQCVVLDHRCFGRSSANWSAFEPRQFGADAVAVLDALRIESAHHVCQSMGGWTGLQLARHHPSRVLSLTLCNTIAGVAYQPAIQHFSQWHEKAGAGGIADSALSEAYKNGNPAGTMLYRQIKAFNPPQDMSALSRLFAQDVLVPPSELGSIVPPVHFIASDDDPLFPAQFIREIADQTPRSTFHSVIGAGHSAYFERPEEFNAILRQCIDE